MFKKLVSKIVGDPTKKLLNDLRPTVDAIAAEEARLELLSDDELRAETAVLRERYKDLYAPED